MKTLVIKAIMSALWTLATSVGTGFLAIDFLLRRRIIWMGVFFAFMCVVSAGTLMFRISVLRRTINQNRLAKPTECGGESAR